jgi:hypothetical protein
VRQIVTAVVFLTVLAAAFALLATESVPVAVVVAVALWASVWVNVVLHELGHLAAALLARVPVVAVRIAPFTGWRNEVLVRPSPSDPAVLALAVPRFTIATQIVLVEASCVALLLGGLNLVPASSHDGTWLRLWLTRPTEVREGLWAARFRAEVSRIVRLVDPGDVEPLTAYLDRHHQPFAEPRADLVEDAERLRDLPGADPAIAQVLCLQFGLWYLYAAAVTRAPVDHEEIVELGELARRAVRARPDQAASTIAMGLAELLAGRPKRARSVLAEVPASELAEVALLLRTAAGGTVPEHAAAGGSVPEHAAGEPVPGDRYPELARVVAAVRAAGPGLAMSQRTPRRQGPVTAAVNPLPSAASP